MPHKEKPELDRSKNQAELTFCLLLSKVDHGPGRVKDCDRGDV